jgi:hypothetical protein
MFLKTNKMHELKYNNLPDDGTLVPKRVAVGTWYEVYFVAVLLCFD